MDQQKLPEQRKDCGGRRDSDKCIFHEAHEIMFADDRADIKGHDLCITAIKREMQTKVNMKLFYATAGGVFAAILIILGVQWGTYQLVNSMALDHERAMGKISATLVEVRADIKHGNIVSAGARDTLKDSLERQSKITEKNIDEIKTQLKKIDAQSHGGNR